MGLGRLKVVKGRICFLRQTPNSKTGPFFVYSLLACNLYSPFPVRCPRSGGLLQVPLFALRPGLSQEDVMRTKETYKRKESERERQRKRRKKCAIQDQP